MNSKTKSFIFALFILLTAGSFSYAQSSSKKTEELPNGYKEIRLGMSVDEVKNALKADPYFGYRGDRDVSFLPGRDKILIETNTYKTAPFSFYERCWFHFYDGKLYIITINLKPAKIDHYSIYSTLTEKYGNPDSLNPEKSTWENDSVIMSLERPLTLKYTDKVTFEKLQNESVVKKSAEEISRQKFLDEL